MATRKKPKGTPRNETPFNGSDPFSKTLANAWSIPGTIAKGFGDVASGKRNLSLGDVAGVVAPAALAAAGIYGARVAARKATANSRATRVSAAANRIASRARTNNTVEAAASDYYRGVASEYGRKYSAGLSRKSDNTRLQQSTLRGIESDYLVRSRKAAESATKIQNSGRMNVQGNEMRINAKIDAIQKSRRKGGR
jgi:hypothetical protein